MQRIDRLGSYMDDIDELYYYVEDFLIDAWNIKGICIDEKFRPICMLINGNIKEFVMPEFNKCHSVAHIYSRGEREILLFSGGKVSLAMALHMKRIGKSPILYYVDNRHSRYVKQSRKKQDMVRDIADKLGMDLVIQPSELDLNNPMSIPRILDMGVEYAIDNGCNYDIHMGVFEGTSVVDNEFNFYGYTHEFLHIIEQIFNESLPDFHIRNALPSYSIAWDELLRFDNREYIPYIVADTPMDESVLYIIKSDYNMISDVSESDYMSHIKKLKWHLESELGRSVSKEELWSRYFFYNIAKSKFISRIF